MNRFALIILLLVLLAAAAYALFFREGEPFIQENNQVESPSANEIRETTSEETPKTHIIEMTSAGFAPAQITVKKGDTVEFVNKDAKSRWPASAPHPTHTIYPEFDPKKGIAVDETFSFKFDKVGSWNYHDHLTPTMFGKVTVTE